MSTALAAALGFALVILALLVLTAEAWRVAR